MIPISKTVFSEAEMGAVRTQLEQGRIAQGPKVEELEVLWARYTGASHAVAVTSCTAALHLALVTLGIGPGDDVLVPAFTGLATANAVEHAGARPLLCDISIETWNVTAHALGEKITRNTKAVIPVHLFGLPAEMELILSFATSHGLYVIEDAACGFAARYRGRHVGTFGQAGCFSFDSGMAITTGEGGMITLEDADRSARLRSLRDHGAPAAPGAGQRGLAHAGYNFRMTDIQGALGAAQMARADEIHRLRTVHANRYREELAGLPWLVLPQPDPDVVHGYQAFVCLLGGPEPHVSDVPRLNGERNRFMEYLQGKGIGSRPGSRAVHLDDFYRERYRYEPEDLPNALIADRCSIELPLSAALTGDELRCVIDAVRSYRPQNL